MPESIPYHCPLCTQRGACGYNGRLGRADRARPTCDHNIRTPKADLKAGQRAAPCHPDPEQMVEHGA